MNETQIIPPVTRRETRDFMISMRWLVLIVVVILAVLLGRSWGVQEAQSADITVQACTEYHPDNAPAFTFTGACTLPDGSLYIPKSK